jgi:hypothetical protein
MDKAIIQRFEWVKLAPHSNRWPYGYVNMGDTSTLLDCVYVPFLRTTFVLTRESSWGTTGGIGKSVVLYARRKNGPWAERERRVITHQFDRSRDCLHYWDFEKISVQVRFKMRDTSDIGIIRGLCGPVRARGAVDAYMDTKPRAQCSISATYYRAELTSCGILPTFEAHDTVVTTTGPVDPATLTKKNICRFFRKWAQTLPEKFR